VQVHGEGEFSELNALLDGECSDLNATIEWSGCFLPPLFVATLLQLDDYIPKLVARGASVDALCLWDNLLCPPLHAAAVLMDAAAVRALLAAKANACSAEAETCVQDTAADDKANLRTGLSRCNVLHTLVARDIYNAEVYSALMAAGARLALPCLRQDGTEVFGFALPRLLGNSVATEAQINAVIGEEVKYTISMPGSAKCLNNLLEVGSTLRGQGPLKDVGYSFFRDVDSRFPAVLAEDGPQPVTALLYAGYRGRSEAARLLLYAGADSTIPARFVLSYSFGCHMILNAQVAHIAVACGHAALLEQLVDFGIDPLATCSATVYHTSDAAVQEQWTGLSWVHIAILAGRADLVDTLLRCRSDINALAYRKLESGEVTDFAPLHLAVVRGDVIETAKLIDIGAVVTDRIRAAAQENEKVCEMFGGPPVVGLEDWLSSLLTGEVALQQLIARRTDLTRPLDWPESTPSILLEGHSLANPDLIRQLVQTLEEVPTLLRGPRPVHLACLLQQPWALDVLASAGVSVMSSPPCMEVPRGDVPLPDGPCTEEAGALSAFPLDAVFLCVRVGGLTMLELLSSDAFRLNVDRAIPLAPDISPPFYPRTPPHGGPEDLALAWAWKRLSPLHYAILYNRIDMAVLLARLGADLLHTTDHIAVRKPNHYSIADKCFKDLTPLHLCALLGRRLAAAALLNEAASEHHFSAVPCSRPRRQEMLSAMCTHAWASLETQDTEEPWLWRNLTPLHVAILCKHYDVAELLVDVSAPETLAMICFQQDMDHQCEKSTSALLLTHEQGVRDLHRKIAQKFPTC